MTALEKLAARIDRLKYYNCDGGVDQLHFLIQLQEAMTDDQEDVHEEYRNMEDEIQEKQNEIDELNEKIKELKSEKAN